MEEHDKAGHEKVKQLVELHSSVVIHLLQLLMRRVQREAEFWKSLLKNVKEVKKQNGKS